VLAEFCPVFPPRPNDEHEFPFTGGAIGYFGYELLSPRKSQGVKQKIDLPDMLVGIYDWALVVDHSRKLPA
jgi:para-aminobenzoate synthetase component I